jgi:hypothetical protein
LFFAFFGPAACGGAESETAIIMALQQQKTAAYQRNSSYNIGANTNRKQLYPQRRPKASS